MVETDALPIIKMSAGLNTETLEALDYEKYIFNQDQLHFLVGASFVNLKSPFLSKIRLYKTCLVANTKQ